MDMDNDDAPVGRILSRREVIVLLGGMGAAVLTACAPRAATPASSTTSASTNATVAIATSAPAAAVATEPVATVAAATAMPSALPSIEPTLAATPAADAAVLASVPACVVSPELTEGPYFVDEKLNRSDIRSDPSDGTVKDGAPLQLTLRISQVAGSGCTTLAGAMVDIWHCDALGVYSDASDRGFNTKGQKFLRGYQVTDANGTVNFTTIYPGWYQGRAVHIHFKVRATTADGKTQEFTSQFFFDESMTDVVHAQAPYASKGKRTLLNDGDNIYQGGGNQLVLPITPASNGYAAMFDIGMQLA